MTSLARVQDVQMSLADTMTLGQVLKSSGFFVDVKEEAQAVAKILAGREIGIGPIASMTGIHIINGRMALGANVIAGRIKGSARYDYRVREMTNERCEIEFFENYGGKREAIGKSEFTLADARKAQTKNIDKFPRNMLFARAISNGARWYTPDVFNGAVYTPDELGAETDEEGNVVDVTPVQPLVIESKPEQPNIWQLDGKGSEIERKVVKGISWITFTLTSVKVAASGELAAVLEEMQEGDVVTVWGTYKKSGNGQEFLQATMVQLIDAVQEAEVIEVAQV